LFGKTPLKAQNDYIFQKFGGHGPLSPLATPMVVREGLQGGTRIGLPLSVYLHKNMFIAMFIYLSGSVNS